MYFLDPPGGLARGYRADLEFMYFRCPYGFIGSYMPLELQEDFKAPIKGIQGHIRQLLGNYRAPLKGFGVTERAVGFQGSGVGVHDVGS